MAGSRRPCSGPRHRCHVSSQQSGVGPVGPLDNFRRYSVIVQWRPGERLDQGQNAVLSGLIGDLGQCRRGLV